MRPTKSMSQAHHGALRTRSSTAASGPLRMSRRSAWRATHSSWPTAGPEGADMEARRWSMSSPCGVSDWAAPPGGGALRSSGGGVESLTSDLSDVGPAEQALRPEDHEGDQDREDDQVRPLRRDVALGVRLREAE